MPVAAALYKTPCYIGLHYNGTRLDLIYKSMYIGLVLVFCMFVKIFVCMVMFLAATKQL